MFALVLFLKTNNVAVVPVAWIKGRRCFCPDLKDIPQLARKMQRPKPHWPKLEVIIKSLYGSYEEACLCENQQVETSVAETETETLGSSSLKRKSHQNVSDESSSSEEVQNSSTFPTGCTTQTNCAPAVELESDTEEIEVIVNSSLESPVIEFQNFPQVIKQEQTESPSDQNLMSVNNKQLSLDESVTESSTSSTNISNLHKEVLNIKRMVKAQGKILSNILGALNVLLREKGSTPVPSSISRLNLDLPVNSVEELLRLEEKLNDEAVKEQLCGVLAHMGGDNLAKAVRRMLLKIMTNAVAEQFSWLGAREKLPLCNLRVARIIFDAVRCRPEFRAVVDSDIENIIKDWLRHAKTRSRGSCQKS